jgi:siroheme decarboxylase
MSRNFKKKNNLSVLDKTLPSEDREGLSLLDKRILNRLQEDIPFCEKPWGSIAGELRIKEDYLLKRIAFFKKKGIIRRISAIFAPGKINFVSTLIGVKAAPGNIARVVKEINSYPEVTHNYRRDGEYNIWFTLVAEKRERITRIIRRLKKNKGIEKMSEFPIVKLFKINVKFAA